MIVLEKAQITVNHQLTGQQLVNRISLVSTLTEAVAEELGAGWLFDDANIARPGYKSLDLDTSFTNADFKHEIPKIGLLTLKAVTAKKFRCYRVEDGKRKSKRLMVAFVVEFGGKPFELIEHMIHVGRGEGVCTIHPGEAQQGVIAEVEAPRAQGAKRIEILKKPEDNAVRYNIPKKPKDNVVRYKSPHKSFMAELFTTEGQEGYFWGCVATVGPQKIKMPVTKEMGPFASEGEALEQAALSVYSKALHLHDTTKEGSESQVNAGKIARWAQKYISAEKREQMTITETAE